MSIDYVCRYCQSSLGRFEESDVSEYRLGFHMLTASERSDIITHGEHGGIKVQVVCEYCRQALEANPELSLISSPLQ